MRFIHLEKVILDGCPETSTEYYLTPLYLSSERIDEVTLVETGEASYEDLRGELHHHLIRIKYDGDKTMITMPNKEFSFRWEDL